jgi:hypothetical protein
MFSVGNEVRLGSHKSRFHYRLPGSGIRFYKARGDVCSGQLCFIYNTAFVWIIYCTHIAAYKPFSYTNAFFLSPPHSFCRTRYLVITVSVIFRPKRSHSRRHRLFPPSSERLKWPPPHNSAGRRHRAVNVLSALYTLRPLGIRKWCPAYSTSGRLDLWKPKIGIVVTHDE